MSSGVYNQHSRYGRGCAKEKREKRPPLRDERTRPDLWDGVVAGGGWGLLASQRGSSRLQIVDALHHPASLLTTNPPNVPCTATRALTLTTNDDPHTLP
jgi:hypothetical protein